MVRGDLKLTKKPKFLPKIICVKLNPEQAVLECACFDYGDVLSDYPQGLFSVPSNPVCKTGRDHYYYTGTNCIEPNNTLS